MSEFLIIPALIAPKLRVMEFDGWNRLDPIKGELDGKEVFFLQAELKENKIFEKALADFEVCEVKDIETVDTKFYDDKGTELTDLTKIDIATTYKTILTAKK